MFWSLKNRFYKHPDVSSIDQSGIVKSDHPTLGNGWMKGWVINTQPKNVVIVCRHANPSTKAPNNKIFVTDRNGVKHERTIVAIDKDAFFLNGKNPPDKYYMHGDIAICLLDSPLPDTVTAYDVLAVKDVYEYYMRPILSFDQYGIVSKARLHFTDENFAYISGKGRDKNLIDPGDSGMPWFMWNGAAWNVVSHSFRGVWGEGPWYSHPNIYSNLIERVKALQKN